MHSYDILLRAHIIHVDARGSLAQKPMSGTDLKMWKVFGAGVVFGVKFWNFVVYIL